jgi:hypothetical protein
MGNREGGIGQAGGGQAEGCQAVPPRLFDHWVHSHEEDSAGEEVHRRIG